MSDRIQKKDIIKIVSDKMKTDEETANLWLETILNIITEFIKKGKTVTLQNFGSFYVRTEKKSRVFRFNPSQKLQYFLGWTSTYKKKTKSSSKNPKSDL